MSFILQPWHLMFFAFAGWANRQQHEVIDYLRTENEVLKEKLGKKRILLNDDQRRRLGVKGKILGRKLLADSVRCGCNPKLRTLGRLAQW
jgi:hypothetical protein